MADSIHLQTPHTYLVDVLQRIETRLANRTHELTPRLWRELFAASPVRSDLDPQRRQYRRSLTAYGVGLNN